MSLRSSPAYRPSYGEFERTIGEGMGEAAPVTERFVRKFIEKLRSLPMNASVNGIAEVVMASVVEDFAELYHALVELDPPFEEATFGEVIAAPKYRILPQATRDMANKAIAEVLNEIPTICEGTAGEGLFVFRNEELPIETAIRWKDLIELSKKTPLYKYLLNLDRELTILCRAFDLLDGMILRQEAG